MTDNIDQNKKLSHEQKDHGDFDEEIHEDDSRLNVDEYFISLAKLVAQRSTCLRRKINKFYLPVITELHRVFRIVLKKGVYGRNRTWQAGKVLISVMLFTPKRTQLFKRHCTEPGFPVTL